MVPGQRACVLLALSLLAADAKLSGTCTEEGSLSPATPLPQALLQAHRTVNPISSGSFIADAKAEVDHKAPNVQEHVEALMRINPSGAAAPLNNEGYLAVAHRCCQAEMQEFIKRLTHKLNLQICEAAGLAGIVQWHTCPHAPQSFEKLTIDLLADSQRRCRWLASNRETCTKPFPEDCEKFEGDITDCGCKQSEVATFDLDAVSLRANNLAGMGPQKTDPEEIRYSGNSLLGQKFDVVVTAIDTYKPGNNILNGVKRSGGFGVINIQGGTTTSFKFSFVEPDTSIPVILSEFHMTTFDLDGEEKKGLESVSSKGYSGYVTDENPSLIISETLDGRAKFTGDAGRNLPNPTDPKQLTQDQRRNSIMFFYKDVSSFELTFGAPATNPTELMGRNLLFAFKSSLEDRCSD